ncbi:MAG: hypothetical protein Hals2KO_39060 [Halioglobus sp.]
MILGILMLIGCAEKDAEAQIAENIAAIESAVETKDFSAISKHLHSSFVANERMSIDEVKQLLRLYSLRHKNLGVAIVGVSTTLHRDYPDRADSTVSVILSGSSGLLPSEGSVRQVEVEWFEESGEWLIRRAAWR